MTISEQANKQRKSELHCLIVSVLFLVLCTIPKKNIKMTQIKYSLSWDAHQNKICQGLSALQQNGEFVDMTLAADGHHVQVHKMVMSLASPYIKELIATAKCPHPVIFLNNVSYSTLSSILEYVYTGEAVVAKEDLSLLLEASRSLHIQGLEKMMTSSIVNNEIQTQNELPQININIKQGTLNQIFETQNNYDDILEDNRDDDGSDENQQDQTCNEVEVKCSEKPPEIKSILENHSLQYTLSSQGNLQIVLNRYIYNLRYTGKTSRRLWRCVQYPRKLRCPAFVITLENQILERKFSHNHPFHDKKIIKKNCEGTIFSAIDDAEKKLINFKKQREKVTKFAFIDANSPTKEKSLPD